MRKRYSCIAAFALFSLQKTVGQTNTLEIGVKISSEFTNGKNDGTAFGIQGIYKLSNHSRIETGLSYKLNQQKYLLFQGLTSQSRPLYEPYSQTEKTLLIPIAYRYESKWMTLSAGTGFNFLLNKKYLQQLADVGKTDWIDNTMEILASFAISKSFRLNRTMYVEPEIKQCFYSKKGGNGFQLNLSFRKRLLK
jgi:hypothetical protein